MGAGDIFISNAFGFTEDQTAFQECSELGGCHTMLPEMLDVEVVDEQTGKRKPDGEPVLLTITHLDRQGTCLLRYFLGILWLLHMNPVLFVAVIMPDLLPLLGAPMSPGQRS